MTVRYRPGDGVDATGLTRLVRDAVPAHLAVRCEATASAMMERRWLDMSEQPDMTEHDMTHEP